jgi:hypothetical protein
MNDTENTESFVSACMACAEYVPERLEQCLESFAVEVLDDVPPEKRDAFYQRLSYGLRV